MAFDKLNLDVVVSASKTDSRSKLLSSPVLLTVDNLKEKDLRQRAECNIHVKGRDRKLAKMVAKSSKASKAHDHDHDHDHHDHDHDHAHDASAAK